MRSRGDIYRLLSVLHLRVNDYFLSRLLVVFSQFLRDFSVVMGANPFVFQCEHQRVLGNLHLIWVVLRGLEPWKEFKFAVLLHRAVLSERKVRLATLGEFCSWRQDKGVNESQVVARLRLCLSFPCVFVRDPQVQQNTFLTGRFKQKLCHF